MPAFYRVIWHFGSSLRFLLQKSNPRFLSSPLLYLDSACD